MTSFPCFSLTSSHLCRAPDLTNWFNMEDLDMKWEEISWLDLKDLFLPLKKQIKFLGITIVIIGENTTTKYNALNT